MLSLSIVNIVKLTMTVPGLWRRVTVEITTMTMPAERGILALLCGALLLTFNAPLAAQCTADPWLSTLSYPRGTIVSHVSHEWRAKRNTAIGVAPGTHKPTWADRGACETDPVEPTPTPTPTPEATPLQIFGVWHCGNSYCDWSVERETYPGSEFDFANNWIIHRNSDGSGLPSVNLVILSFLEPMKLLDGETGGGFSNGVPLGMTTDVVNYFKDHDIRVMVSMGGVTYTDAWNEALTTNPVELANKAFALVLELGLDGLEIDWENGTPDDLELVGIEEFIAQYNSLRAGYANQFLTLDLAVGNRDLQELSRRAAADWLPNGKIDYVNAMVPRGEPSTDQWQEHVDGKSNYNPPILPKAPAKVAVSLWLTDGRRPNENCIDFDSSSQKAKAGYVQTVAPNGAGTSSGFLGYMFWAAECPATRNVCTTPPNTCEGGMGEAAIQFLIPVPMEPLRQE